MGFLAMVLALVGCVSRPQVDDDTSGADDDSSSHADDDATGDDDDATGDDDDATGDDDDSGSEIWSPCSTFDFILMDGACQDAPLATDPGGPTVCACPVATDAAAYCTPPDPRAPLASVFIRADDPDHLHFGTYPDMSSVDGCLSDGDWSPFDGIPASNGVMDMDVGGGEDRQWIEPTPTPDSVWFALFDRIAPNQLHHLTLVGCEEGNGWLAERLIQPVTSPFVRWGADTEPYRQLYLMSDDFYRVTLAADVQDVVTDDGVMPALLFKEIQWLAASEAGNLAMGDFDVSYVDGGAVDEYAVFLSALEARLIPLYVRGGIYVTDLSDCVEGCDASSGLKYCCKTAFLVEGDLDNPDTPTNPALAPDGSLISYNRFTSDMGECPLGLCAEVHVLKNPLAHTDLYTEFCAEDATHDGFTDAVDCTSLMMTGGLFDDDKCPDYHCCDDGADCSRCTTIGESPGEVMGCSGTADGVRERNYIAFFEVEDSLYLGFRSTDILGANQVDMHVLRVELDGSGDLVVPDDDDGYPMVFDMAGLWMWDLTNFATGPYRKIPDEDPCD